MHVSSSCRLLERHEDNVHRVPDGSPLSSVGRILLRYISWLRSVPSPDYEVDLTLAIIQPMGVISEGKLAAVIIFSLFAGIFIGLFIGFLIWRAQLIQIPLIQTGQLQTLSSLFPIAT
jgi:hypothetical protein